MAHTHYKGTGKVYSFRGLLVDMGATLALEDQRRIRIQGATGDRAWRIIKLELFPVDQASQTESVVQVWREKQSSFATTVNFENDEVLAVALLVAQSNPNYVHSSVTVFDNAIFTRNIWLTHVDAHGANAVNYYIELEEVKISAAGMAQLAVAAARRLK